MKTVDVLIELIGQGVRFKVGENDTVKMEDKRQVLTVKTYQYLKANKADLLALVRVVLKPCHCTSCKAHFWHDVGQGDCAGCPACFGHEVLHLVNYPTELDALRDYPEWKKSRAATTALHLSTMQH